MTDEHAKAVEATIESVKAKDVSSGPAGHSIFTMEFVRSEKQGVYMLHAYDESGLQIVQLPVLARVKNILSALSDAVVDAGIAGSFPMVGAEDYQRPSARSSGGVSGGGGGGDEKDYGMLDILEGIAGALRKTGAK